MRIISKYKDYYDGVGGYGEYGDSMVYVRDNKRLDMKVFRSENPDVDVTSVLKRTLDFFDSIPKPRNDCYFKNGLRVSRYVSVFMIGFCGRAYPIISYDEKFFGCYDSFFAYVEHKSKDEEGLFFSDRYNEYKRLLELLISENRREEEGRSYLFGAKLFARNNWPEQGFPIGDEVFRMFNAPVFKVQNHGGEFGVRYILNPELRELGFASFVDPFTAYQEIDMYLGNNLVKADDASINRTNDLIRDSKGFDKNSFRNTVPSTKKQRRKANGRRKRKAKFV